MYLERCISLFSVGIRDAVPVTHTSLAGGMWGTGEQEEQPDSCRDQDGSVCLPGGAEPAFLGEQLLQGASCHALPSPGNRSKVLTGWEMLLSRLSPAWSQFEF